MAVSDTLISSPFFGTFAQVSELQKLSRLFSEEIPFWPSELVPWSSTRICHSVPSAHSSRQALPCLHSAPATCLIFPSLLCEQGMLSMCRAPCWLLSTCSPFFSDSAEDCTRASHMPGKHSVAALPNLTSQLSFCLPENMHLYWSHCINKEMEMQ